MIQIDKELILRALARMGELALERGITLEICVYGGAAMMLAYNSRDITRDLDAVISPSDAGSDLAGAAAAELDLPDDWLNDQVKVFAAPSEATRALPLNLPGIRLTVPTASYLLAMKAIACRQPLPGFQGDVDDLRFLIRKLGIETVAEIQSHVDKYYPDDVISDDHTALLQILIDEVKNERH